MKILLLFCILFTANTLLAQGDFLLLRKNNITIQTYVKGSFISLQLSNRQWIEGRIQQIKGDSLIINQMVVRQVANSWGLPTIDTIRLGLNKLKLIDIYALPLKKQHNSIFANGLIFQVGAVAYIGLNVLNGIIKNEAIFSTQNITNLGIAASVFLVGKILQWLHPNSIVLGKKYKLYTTDTLIL